MAKAEQFARAATVVRDLADEADDVADAYVTLCVHAGIAAADVICAVRLGYFASGERHDEAVTLLSSVDGAAAKHLAVLLGMKTAAGYGHAPVSSTRAVRAGRAAEALVEAARTTR